MYLHDTVLGIIFLSQTGVGVLGNSIFLWFYTVILFTRHRWMPMDSILTQLTLTNTIVLLSQGCPLAISYFSTGYFLGITMCKIVFYLQRVSRGLSICTTCLLSTFQALTISPSNSRLAKLKVRVLEFTYPLCLLCCIINMILEVNVPIYISGSRSRNSTHSSVINLLYCYWEKFFIEIIILPSLRDILCVGCMVCTSGYMVFLLHRHHQKVKHIHRTSFSSKTSPEIKATQTILLLVGSFVSAYCVSCGFILYKVYVMHSGTWVMIVTTFIALCYPTISPFLLIHRAIQIPRSFCAAWWRPNSYSQNKLQDLQVISMGTSP
ncbi:vomeronasal type-1 receptor 4-like [Trichosurus vulpecula]|uniref:vomeronasal type-1 receptor 4-like n=1 Tax=Trichosurus vulpecula TaxID=9337 RepID=UPI00186AFFE8|nr:vomeronasal type-1 receptor 4-like [Trichosurus vulpecula]